MSVAERDFKKIKSTLKEKNLHKKNISNKINVPKNFWKFKNAKTKEISIRDKDIDLDFNKVKNSPEYSEYKYNNNNNNKNNNNNNMLNNFDNTFNDIIAVNKSVNNSCLRSNGVYNSEQRKLARSNLFAEFNTNTQTNYNQDRNKKPFTNEKKNQ